MVKRKKNPIILANLDSTVDNCIELLNNKTKEILDKIQMQEVKTYNRSKLRLIKDDK